MYVFSHFVNITQNCSLILVSGNTRWWVLFFILSRSWTLWNTEGASGRVEISLGSTFYDGISEGSKRNIKLSIYIHRDFYIKSL